MNAANAKASLMQKFTQEMKEFVVIYLYLCILIGAFNTYKGLLMAEYHVGYFVYGYALVEALILAKIILLGESLGIGERFSGRPLIIPTLYKTMLFALLVLAFNIPEHLIRGFLHGKDLSVILHEVIRDRYEILSQVVVMFVAFIPFFAFGEIKRVLGGVKLFDLFFRSKTALQSASS